MRISKKMCNFAWKNDMHVSKMMNKQKYPIGVQSFEVLRERGYVYVDKTDLMYELAQQHICFLCRPRRFGKSLLLSTLEAYFRGKQQLFDGLKIMLLENEWQQYPVFHLDFNGVNFTDSEGLDNKLDDALATWEREYHIIDKPKNIGDRFVRVLQQAYVQTGKRCVVLIDEYDKPLLDVLGEKQELTNRNVLKGFYSAFKAADQYLRFVLLTGVTKFSQVSVFSGFNQPLDISMNPKYETICGITDQELSDYFADSMDELSVQYGLSNDDMKHLLKQRYDGYHFSPACTDVYNPFSLLNVFVSGELSDYWFASGTPMYLIRLLENREVDLSVLLSRAYEASYFIDYRATVADPLAMLYQSGYLTIKSVERQVDGENLYWLDFPNVEVKRGFVTMLGNSYFAVKEDFGGVVRDMFYCLRDYDMPKLQRVLNTYLSSIDYVMRKDKEYHFQYTLYLLFSLISTYAVRVEQHNSQGRADLIVETREHVYIFEFKLGGTAREALQQIEGRGYAVPYGLEARPIHKIGVSFGKKSGRIDDWAEE